MSRAYVIYFVMFGVLIGGMLLILTIGDAVHAPDDLSGEWTVEWDNAPPPESAEPKMRVDQSGRFFVVTFGRRPPMSLTLRPGWTGAATGRKVDMTLARRDWALHLTGPIPMKEHTLVPELKVELVGPTRHVGIARRGVPQGAAAAARGLVEASEPAKASATIRPVHSETPNAR
jgi:hypothetical protein